MHNNENGRVKKYSPSVWKSLSLHPPKGIILRTNSLPVCCRREDVDLCSTEVGLLPTETRGMHASSCGRRWYDPCGGNPGLSVERNKVTGGCKYVANRRFQGLVLASFGLFRKRVKIPRRICCWSIVRNRWREELRQGLSCLIRMRTSLNRST